MVVLLSGGIDSTAALIWATKQVGADGVLALFVDYGQPCNTHENLAAQRVVKNLDVQLERAVVRYPWTILGPKRIDDPWVVPGRNAVLLSLGAALAQAKGMDSVVLASHQGDAKRYADCRYVFVTDMAKTLKGAYGVTVLAPFIEDPKAELVRQIPDWLLPLTRSCYRPGVQPCDDCAACIERRAACAAAS